MFPKLSRHHSAEEKIRIVLEGLRISQTVFSALSGMRLLACLIVAPRQLKETLAEVLIENRLLKKAFSGMGRTLHEVFRIREVRDHRTGGTVVALNAPDTGSIRDPEIDVLRLVLPITGGRDRSSGGWQAKTAADLE